MELLRLLKPSYWFSAHLHCKFPAVFRHEEEKEKGEGETKEQEGGEKGEKRVTKFLALDKCLPKRQFLQVSVFKCLQV